MTLELTPEQRDALLDLINRELLEIGEEIRHTNTPEYRKNLKQGKQVLHTVQEMLAPQPAAHGG